MLMSDLAKIIIMCIATFLVALCIYLWQKAGDKYEDIIGALDEKKYKYKELFPVGFMFMELIHFDMHSNLVSKKRKEMEEITEKKYATFYLYVLLGSMVSYALILFPAVLMLAVLSGDWIFFALGIVLLGLIIRYLYDTVDDQIKAIDAEIESIIAADLVLTRQKELLTSIDGIGDRIAINMIAITGGFTRFENARHFCSFAGLTPYKYDSGTSVRSKAKISKRANQTMKALLHMSAVNVATRMKEGEYKDYYERKLKEGKHVMCILNVLRAKLVHRMFSVVRRDEMYTKKYQPAS